MKANASKGYCEWSVFRDFFSDFDLFGKPITLNYKGRNSFKTPWGACVTILAAMVFLWIFLAILTQIVTQPLQKRFKTVELVNPHLADGEFEQMYRDEIINVPWDLTDEELKANRATF